jgi:hypothetical protein
MLSIVGIIATVIVGIVIFLMQKKADNKINKIIISEHTGKKDSQKAEIFALLCYTNRIYRY